MGPKAKSLLAVGVEEGDKETRPALIFKTTREKRKTLERATDYIRVALSETAMPL